jgi:peptidoglycan/LPS O-acetylase OafA/YrhL
MKEYFTEIFKSNPLENNGLYGVRAIGCYIVILFHCYTSAKGFLPLYLQSWIHYAENFEFVMDLFFVMSSFLVTYSFSNEILKHSFQVSWKNFFIKRSLRIFPPFFVLLGIALLLMGGMIQAAKIGVNLGVLADGVPGLEIRFANWWADAFYISNYFSQRILIHGWSLSMEEQFYLGMPIFFLLYSKYCNTQFKKFATLFSLIFFQIALRFFYYFNVEMNSHEEYVQKVYHPIHTHFDSFLAGILLMEVVKLDKAIKEKYFSTRNFYLIFVPVFAFYLISFLFEFETHKMYTVVFRISFFALFSWLIVFGIIFGCFHKIRFIFNNPVVVGIGKLSYGVYLVHMLVSAIVMVKMLDHNEFELNTPFRLLFASIVSLFFCYLISLLSYYLIEKPFIKIREWSQPKFNIKTQSFYLVSSTEGERKIVSFLLTILCFVPFFFVKQFIKIDFIPKNSITNILLGLLFVLPILLNLYAMLKHRKLYFAYWIDQKNGITIESEFRSIRQ